MELEALVIRLEELSKKVGYYLSFRDMGVDLLSNENIIEYEAIEKKVESEIIEEINKRSFKIFENINQINFNLPDIDKQLESLIFTHWQSRNELEIKRDKLLYLQYQFYTCQYKEVTKYKELMEIDIKRKQFKEEIKLTIINELKNKLIDELNSNNIQELLHEDNRSAFLNAMAKEYCESRSEIVKQRDVFGYIDINDYEKCLRISLQQAIVFIQSTSKAESIELFVNYLRIKINETIDEEYYGDMNTDLYEYASILFKNRPPHKIADDNSKLIEFDTYLQWRYFAIEQIVNEYPNIFPEEDDDEDNDYDYNEIGNNLDSKYEKYGGYNGYDDETIDEAFEGDPSNTWNVD